jgi:UDP-glucose 4-epimerase
MSVLVLGGSGFLGSAAAYSLSEQNVKVTVLCRSEPEETLFGSAPIEICTADFTSLTAADSVFDGVETVLHFISSTTPASSMDDMAFDVTSNLLPTLNLLRIMDERKIRRLIFASSGGTVYGVPAKLPAAEDDPTNPISAHGITKLAIEKFIALQTRLSELQAVILRIGNPFGPYQLRGVTIGSIARFVQLHAAHRPIHVWGDGAVVRDYLYIDDFCQAISAIVAKRDFPSGVYNLASNSGHSLLDILQEVGKITEREPVVSFEAPRSIDVPAIVLDTSRLLHALPSWRPRVSFADGIERMWRAVSSEVVSCP